MPSPCLLHRWSPRVTVPACIFGGKLDGVRSPLLTLSSRWKRTKDKQEKKKKTLPNQDDNRWELWVSVAPTADGRRLPAALLRPEDPSRHHPQSRQARPGACIQHQQMGGMDGRGGPPRQATSPQIPAASHQRQPGGGPPATPLTVFAKDRRLEVDRPHGGRKRHMGVAQLCWPCWGQTCHTGTLGPPGRVLCPASISALWPLSPCGPHLEGHISLCNLSPPHPGMRGHAAPDSLASSRTWKVSAL